MTAAMWIYFGVMLMCNAVAALIIISLAGAFGKRWARVCACTLHACTLHAHAHRTHTACSLHCMLLLLHCILLLSHAHCVRIL